MSTERPSQSPRDSRMANASQHTTPRRVVPSNGSISYLLNRPFGYRSAGVSSYASRTNLSEETPLLFRQGSECELDSHCVDHLVKALDAERTERMNEIADLRAAVESSKCAKDVSPNEIAELRVMTLDLQEVVRYLAEDRPRTAVGSITDLAQNLRQHMQELTGEARSMCESSCTFKEQIASIVRTTDDNHCRLRDIEDALGNITSCMEQVIESHMKHMASIGCDAGTTKDFASEGIGRNEASQTRRQDAVSSSALAAAAAAGALDESFGHSRIKKSHDALSRLHEWAALDSGGPQSKTSKPRGCTREEPDPGEAARTGELSTIVEGASEEGRESPDAGCTSSKNDLASVGGISAQLLRSLTFLKTDPRNLKA